MAAENSSVRDEAEKQEIDLSDISKDKAKSGLAKYGGIIALVVIIVVFIAFAAADFNIGQWFANITILYYESAGEIGIYFAVFLIALVGNLTIIFPVPYTVVIIVISAVLSPTLEPDQIWYFPLVVGIFSGIGSAIGEISAWCVGRGAREWASFKESPKVNRMKRWVDKGMAPILIFIFAITPLADDPFLMVLGFVGYPLARAILWCFLGKWGMGFLISGLTLWFSDTDWGQALIRLFGIDIVAARTGQVPEDINLVTSTITWILTFTVVIALIYVDWDKIAEKLKIWNTTPRQTYYPPKMESAEVSIQDKGVFEPKSSKAVKDPSTGN